MARLDEIALEELLERYNRCFYDQDLDTLRRLYIADERGFVYFDNHPDADSTSLDDHLAKVAAFFFDGQVVPLETEILATSTYGDAGCLVARLRYHGSSGPSLRTSLFAERHDRELENPPSALLS